MSIVVNRRWSTTLAGSLMLALAACASNSVKTPMAPGGDPGVTAAEKETGRYGTLLRLASATRSGGDPGAAARIYQQAIALDGDRPEAYLLLGDALLDLQAYDEAARIFEAWLQRDDNNLAAHKGYARVMVSLNRPEPAILHYRKVLQLAPEDLQAHNGLAVALDLAGRPEEAETAYRNGLKLAPDSTLLRNNLGLSLALAGRQQEAIELLRKVVDEPGAGPRNRQNLALAYGLAGDLAAAERIARLDLDDDAVRKNLSYFSMLAGLDDRRKRATALGVQRADAGSAKEPEPQRRLAAFALDGDGIELGFKLPAGRWFVELGSYPDEAAANAAWRRLRGAHGEALRGLTRLAGTAQARQPLLAGPLRDEASAQALCEKLTSQGDSCHATPL